MNKETINKKRLAKNTLMLYIRMLLVMVVTFFTTRVILEKLGVEDYGIYHTIAGIVVMFAFLNKAMVTTTQRFLNFYLGKDDTEGARKHFSQSLIVHYSIAILIAVLAEGIGLWFLYYKMKFPVERFDAAFWTLQLSVLITFFNIIRTPYNACIIAHEKMNFYAYISIVEVILKLVILYMLTMINCDKLIMYSCLLLFVSVTIMMTYKIYCNTKYPISKFTFEKDKRTFMDLLSFSGYSLLGNAANAGATQGVSMIMNTFVGVIANASAGVCAQINAGLYSLVSNFQLAFNPQLIKTYAKNDFNGLRKLICQTSRFSYYLMSIISIPVILHCNQILSIWLSEVPEYSVSFCKWIILSTLVTTLEEPLWITVQASGKIKRYQIICSLIIFLNLPATYLVLYFQLHPSYVFFAKMCINLMVYVFRFSYVHDLISLPFDVYLKDLLIPVAFVTTLISVLCYGIYSLNVNFWVSISMMVTLSILVIGTVGVKKNERSYLLKMIRKK